MPSEAEPAAPEELLGGIELPVCVVAVRPRLEVSRARPAPSKRGAQRPDQRIGAGRPTSTVKRTA